jgi:hypothetical protein
MTIVASSPAGVAGADVSAGATAGAMAGVVSGVALPVTGSSGVVALVGAALIAVGVALQGVRRFGAGLRH